jgi:glucose/arabinose dehydrogenase
VTRRSFASAPLIAVLLLAGALPSPALGAQPSLRATVVQSGLVNPWDVAFAPGGQMFVTERPGRVRVFGNGNKGATLLATTTIPNVRAIGEAGVMGIAVDGNFGTNRYVYVCASRLVSGQWLNQVIRYRVTTGWQLAFSKYVIRFGMRANTTHNGCAVEIGPDNKLWVSMGDSANEALAQNPTALNGKILRMNRNGTVPSDNPIMPGTSTRTRVYSMGHRNPQGIAFDETTGRVYAIEHGPNVSDEINWIRPGKNYGWPCVTGAGTPYHNGYAACSQNAPFANPVWHSGGSTIATSGATFVRGYKWQAFRGQLFVAQLKQQDLRRFKVVDPSSRFDYKATYFNERWGRLRAATLGPGDRLWITTSNGSNDKVIRINPVPSG